MSLTKEQIELFEKIPNEWLDVFKKKVDFTLDDIKEGINSIYRQCDILQDPVIIIVDDPIEAQYVANMLKREMLVYEERKNDVLKLVAPILNYMIASNKTIYYCLNNKLSNITMIDIYACSFCDVWIATAMPTKFHKSIDSQIYSQTKEHFHLPSPRDMAEETLHFFDPLHVMLNVDTLANIEFVMKTS